MDAFITRKKKRKSGPETNDIPPPILATGGEDDESTDLKLAMLSSLHVDFEQETLLDLLLAHDGSVQATSQAIRAGHAAKKSTSSVTAQASLRSFGVTATSSEESHRPIKKSKLLSRKGATLHLYDPHDIAEHTPCSIIHNFLPPDEANGLLVELLEESKTFEKITFKLFDNVVSSPHTSSFYVGSLDELNAQKYDYTYNGSKLTVSRPSFPLPTRNTHQPSLGCPQNHTPPRPRQTPRRRSRQLRNHPPYRHPPSWPASPLPVHAPLDPQRSLCKLLQRAVAKRRLAQRPADLPRPARHHRLAVARRRARVPRPPRPPPGRGRGRPRPDSHPPPAQLAPRDAR